VFPRRPTLVTLSAGINDVLHKVPDGDYEKSVAAIAERTKAERVTLVVLTTSVLGPRHADADEHLAAYNAVLRGVAARYGLRVADVDRLMRDARTRGADVLEEDQVHPNFAGHRIMARAVLDALGYSDVAVPETMKVDAMPGLVRDWKVRAVPDKSPPLDEKAVVGVAPDESWTTITLPETEPASSWWLDQERQRGFATGLEKRVGKSRRYQAVATVESDAAKRAYLNPGADVEAIWLNGARVYKRPDVYTGWHAGRERVGVDLKAGKNGVVLETGGAFFLSVTDNDDG
jgi:hypothetical protein